MHECMFNMSSATIGRGAGKTTLTSGLNFCRLFYYSVTASSRRMYVVWGTLVALDDVKSLIS